MAVRFIHVVFNLLMRPSRGILFSAKRSGILLCYMKYMSQFIHVRTSTFYDYYFLNVIVRRGSRIFFAWGDGIEVNFIFSIRPRYKCRCINIKTNKKKRYLYVFLSLFFSINILFAAKKFLLFERMPRKFK